MAATRLSGGVKRANPGKLSHGVFARAPFARVLCAPVSFADHRV